MRQLAEVRAMASLASVPQWSRDVKSLRSSLKLTQTELGKRLKCSAMAVSRWERGEHPPAAAYYLALAKIAGRDFGWTFWNLAGISEDDLQRMPALKARAKKQQHNLSNAIAILEIEVTRSAERATRREALFPDLPTQGLRREYKTIATEEANFARVVANHVQMLKNVP
jgi:transcriptional regulator with XRE-family HTH domain